MEFFAGLFALSLGWFWFSLVFLTSLISLASTALWIWILVEVLVRETDKENNKLIWVLVVLLTGWIGAVIYLFVRRQKRIEEIGK